MFLSGCISVMLNFAPFVCMLQGTFMYWPYSYPFESIKSAVLDKTVDKIAYLNEGHFFETS